MKNLIITSLFFLVVYTISAQVPQAIKYQGNVKDVSGNCIKNRQILIKVNLIPVGYLETIEYSEIHQVTTEENGKIEIKIGQGSPVIGSFEKISWNKNQFQIRIDIDEENDGEFVETGTIELFSVPYAFYAEKSGTSADNKGVEWTRNPLTNSVYLTNINDRVGIGITNPKRKLHIKGNIACKDSLVMDFGYSNINKYGNISLIGNIASPLPDTSCQGNIKIGNFAGNSMKYLSWNNICLGNFAGNKLNYGSSNNIFMGHYAGPQTSFASDIKDNVFIGSYTGYSFLNGSSNITIGKMAGRYYTTGNYNIFIGQGAGMGQGGGSFIDADDNIFIGRNAGHGNHTGRQNTFIGSFDCGGHNYSGSENVFLGGSSGESNLTGSSNTYIGHKSGWGGNGSFNTYIGDSTGFGCQNGNYNVFIGFKAGASEIGSNKLYIDNTDTNTPLLYGDFNSNYFKINGTAHIKDFFALESTQISVIDNYSTISPLSSYLILETSGMLITLNALNAISDGSFIGQVLIIQGPISGSIVIPDNANTELPNDISLYNGDVITLLWNGNNWMMTSFSDN